MKFVKKNGRIARFGNKENVFSKELCDKIRKRLNLTEKQLPDKVIKKVTFINNIEMGKFIVDNPEGFMLKDMGVMAASKHLPKELRGDKEDILERIMNYDISETRRQQYLKRYNVDIGRRMDYNKLLSLKEQIPHLNVNTYFYTFRIMWFNHRNCRIKKARAYEFLPNKPLHTYFHNVIMDGKDYYEWTFTDFYRHKVKAKY